MNILVLRGGALGDFIVTLPALVALRAQWPEANIALAGNAVAAQLAVKRGVLDQVHSQNEARWSALYSDTPLSPPFAQWLAEFDIVVSYWPDPDGTLARRFPTRAGQRFVAAAAMPARRPAAAHYCAALEPLGIHAHECFCRIEPTRIAVAPVSDRRSDRIDVAQDLPPSPSLPPSLRYGETKLRTGLPPHYNRSTQTIAIHPGSGSPKKNWPAERWIELIDRLHAPILLIVGEAEANTWSEARLANSPLGEQIRTGLLRIASNLSLEALVDELRACRLFLGHDSGVSHLAAACGVPCVLLFGPTDPALWAPPAEHVRVLRHDTDLAAISVEGVSEEVQRATCRSR